MQRVREVIPERGHLVEHEPPIPQMVVRAPPLLCAQVFKVLAVEVILEGLRACRAPRLVPVVLRLFLLQPSFIARLHCFGRFRHLLECPALKVPFINIPPAVVFHPQRPLESVVLSGSDGQQQCLRRLVHHVEHNKVRHMDLHWYPLVLVLADVVAKPLTLLWVVAKLACRRTQACHGHASRASTLHTVHYGHLPDHPVEKLGLVALVQRENVEVVGFLHIPQVPVHVLARDKRQVTVRGCMRRVAVDGLDGDRTRSRPAPVSSV